ncbi:MULTISPECIES: hypothetical protein [Mycobacteroides]|uniref:Uncharacterized protein n=1 Tax=Mycobacteroides chelonae TaxID=1774 RepID=A0A1S1LR50_MYCCH|nr:MULTISPECIES: hypothetical protein [Mycobacteroides]KRQ26748.1 hypothetical protein AOT87_01685 [Mycobacteroides sp. H003]KRQ28603.1 hypothetical protein AOT91_17335 [Mycobacteroides sp. H092]KRQ44014.1 hypothetical protein AOT92_06640 [Mycobacteroides sp. H101]KRQ50884.1 hypothetical protein AOT88_05580 [Mycobacteroides sp. H063]KRQ57348.1 hypothetical protein AOT94_15225 [Mycobacteroides sp. HXVII]
MAYFLGQRLAELVLFGPIILLIVWLATRRLRRKPSQQNHWEHAVRTCAVNPAFRLGQIIEVLSSDAEQGERARIAWHGTDIQQEIWFGDAWPLEDVWVVVSGANGDGAAERNPQVFYVSEVHDIIVL